MSSYVQFAQHYFVIVIVKIDDHDHDGFGYDDFDENNDDDDDDVRWGEVTVCPGRSQWILSNVPTPPHSLP